MKKTILTLLASLVGVAAFAQAFDLQTADSICEKLNRGIVADAAVLDEAQKLVDAAQPQTDGEKLAIIRLRTRLNFQRAGGKIAWADHQKFVDEQIAAAKFTQNPSSEDYLKILYLWGVRTYDNEIYALMTTLPDYQKWNNAGHVAYYLGKYEESYNLYLVNRFFPQRAVEVAGDKLHDPVRAFEAAKLAISGSYSAETVKQVVVAVTRFVIGQPGVPEEELKAFLNNLNRKCSVNMVADQASWEPIVTMLRTLLATY